MNQNEAIANVCASFPDFETRPSGLSRCEEIVRVFYVNIILIRVRLGNDRTIVPPSMN